MVSSAVRSLSFVCLCVFAAMASAAETVDLPAFPGAEGFGAVTPGGRGGRVMKVTNLNADGPGSLQAACAAEGPRIVVFDVSGVIEGDVTIMHPYITIAGETAPGGGVTINGMLSTVFDRDDFVHDVIVRFLRVRARPGKGANGDAIQFSCVDNAIIDHCSLSWAEDETLDIYSRATNVTVQWCTIEESATIGHPESRHNYGLIAGVNSKRLTIHHNLFSHHARRCPSISSGPADFRNNVVYNFRDGFCHDGGYRGISGFNIVANYYKEGPSDPHIFPFCFREGVPYHIRDNYVVGLGIVKDPWEEADRLHGFDYYRDKGSMQPEPTPCPPVATQSAESAYESVLSSAGCFPRDVVTLRNVTDTMNRTGKWGVVETPNLFEGLEHQAPLADTDGDGMPDEWEREKGLDSAADDSAKVTKSGYTAIEEYCHEMAARKLDGAGAGAVR